MPLYEHVKRFIKETAEPMNAKYEKLGEGPKAVGMYERGLELDGQHPGLLAAMGRVRR